MDADDKEPRGTSDELEASNAVLQAEVEALRARFEASRRERRRRMRRIATGALVVLTTLSVVAATVGVWTHRTAFNTDRYVELVAPLAKEPGVQRALAGYVTEQVFGALDVEARVEAALASSDRLAEHAALLAPAIATGARRLINEQVRNLLDSEAFQVAWTRILTIGHEKVVALLRGQDEELPSVTVARGEVRLNLIPIVAGVISGLVDHGTGLVAPDVTLPMVTPEELPEAARDRLATALGHPLPEDFGQVTIMSEQRLSELQEAVRSFDRFVWALLALSVVLVLVTLTVSVSRRRTLLQLAIGVVVALFLGGVVIRRIREELLAAVTSPTGRQAAREAFAATLNDLRSTGMVVLWVAVAIAIVAYLAGRPPWLTRAGDMVRGRAGSRRIEPWVGRHADGLRLAILGSAGLVLFFTGIDWVPVLVVMAAAAAALWGVGRLRRRVTAAPGGSPHPST